MSAARNWKKPSTPAAKDFAKNKKILIFLGRLIHSKGIGHLIDAMPLIPEIELKVIGWGEQKLFEDYAKSKKLKNIEFLGPIFGEKKLLYLSAADCLILPSSKEGAPVTIMEAIAKNLPVVATNIGGVSLMIKTGREGIILKNKSPREIARAIREVFSWKKKNIQEYGEKYRWKNIIEETVKEYNSI